MAIDIHKLVNGRHQEHLYAIDDNTYESLKPALEIFKRRTGLSIDRYGDTKFTSGLISFIQAIESAFPLASETPKSIALLLTFLKEAEARGDSLIFCGD